MATRWLACAGLVALCGGGLLFAAPASLAPVRSLRAVLQTSFTSLEVRDAALAEQIATLQALTDIFEALQLNDWRVQDPDDNLADVDRAAWQALAQRFVERAGIVLRREPDDRKLAVLAMLNVLGNR